MTHEEHRAYLFPEVAHRGCVPRHGLPHGFSFRLTEKGTVPESLLAHLREGFWHNRPRLRRRDAVGVRTYAFRSGKSRPIRSTFRAPVRRFRPGPAKSLGGFRPSPRAIDPEAIGAPRAGTRIRPASSTGGPRGSPTQPYGGESVAPTSRTRSSHPLKCSSCTIDRQSPVARGSRCRPHSSAPASVEAYDGSPYSTAPRLRGGSQTPPVGMSPRPTGLLGRNP
jgi:hypothetical protein